MDKMIVDDCVYDKPIQYMRKNKWKNCQLKIKIVKRCQDKLVALIVDNNDKTVCQKFEIYGYECNNVSISLIENNDIHLIKFESIELVSQLTQLLVQYMKDVSFKIQLRACTSVYSVLLVNEWYSLHVQTNRICFTTDTGNHLVTKWNRANIGDCCLENCSLNIEIISKKDRCLYSFFRDEKFPLEKLFKAIQNLKFELPQPRPEKFTLTPRRSGSVDLRRLPTWGNTRDRITRDRTNSFSRAEDSLSNDDSSPPSTPVTPLCLIGTNEAMMNYHTHIDEKDEENDDLMFPLDIPKSNGYGDSNNDRRLVHLERFPFESDLKIQGKLSPELNSQHSNDQQIITISNPNIYDKPKNGACYHTMESLLHHRKTSSEANFVHHRKDNDTKTNISHSADVNSDIITTFSSSSTDKISNCSSPLRPLSSSNQSSSSKSKDPDDNSSNYQQRLSPIIMSFSDSSFHNYHNIKNIHDTLDSGHCTYPLSPYDDSQYYNLAPQISSTNKDYFNLLLNMPSDHVSYVELDFQDTPYPFVSKKAAPLSNYTEINLYETEILKGIDDNINSIVSKKKKPSLFKSIFRK